MRRINTYTYCRWLVEICWESPSLCGNDVTNQQNGKPKKCDPNKHRRTRIPIKLIVCLPIWLYTYLRAAEVNVFWVDLWEKMWKIWNVLWGKRSVLSVWINVFKYMEPQSAVAQSALCSAAFFMLDVKYITRDLSVFRRNLVLSASWITTCFSIHLLNMSKRTTSSRRPRFLYRYNIYTECSKLNWGAI